MSVMRTFTLAFALSGLLAISSCHREENRTTAGGLTKSASATSA